MILAWLLPTFNAPGVNWLEDITGEITKLTTAFGGQLVDIANVELTFVAIIGLVTLVSKWQLDHMNIGYHAVNFRIGDFFAFMIRLMFCSVMLFYYNNPLPGGLNLHQIPQAFGSAIATNLDTASYDQLSARISAAINGTVQPSGLDMSGHVIYFSVLALMAVLELGMFIVNAFGFVGYAAFSLFGPLMIPLLLTKHFAGKFWNWVDGLTVYGMYGAVSASFTFIWLHVLVGFFDNSMAGDYSIGKWSAMLAGLIILSVSFLWAMLKVPSVTASLFGGVGGPAQQATDSMVAGISAAAAAKL
ncbi:MAG: hypothetical protein NVS9B4_00260 [Candidatus Acidiferrum sp.]